MKKRKSYTPGGGSNIDELIGALNGAFGEPTEMKSVAVLFAETIKEQYDALVAVGFTAEQALQLTVAALKSA